MKKVTSPALVAPVKEASATTKVSFQLRQANGNHVSFELNTVSDLMQDQFAGTYLFPALLRIVKGSSKMFDRTLPVTLAFAATHANGETSAKVLANVTIKSASVMAVRRAVLVFNETLAGLVVPATRTSIYTLQDMKAGKGAAFRAYAGNMLRPSVSLSAALPIAN